MTPPPVVHSLSEAIGNKPGKDRFCYLPVIIFLLYSYNICVYTSVYDNYAAMVLGRNALFFNLPVNILFILQLFLYNVQLQ